MPVVKTESTYFGGKPFRMRVNIAADGKFKIRLPDYSHEALGETHVESKTMHKAIEEFERLGKVYAKMLQQERKVIRYVFRIQEQERKYGERDHIRSDISFGVGKGVQFGVANLIETTHCDADGEVQRHSYEYPNDDQPYPLGYNFGDFDSMRTFKESHTVEWTEERECWFMSLCQALDSLIGKIKKLDESESVLLQAVAKQVLFSGIH